MIHPAAAMIWTLLLYFGWQAFEDGPRAFYVMVGVSVVLLGLLAALHGGRVWWPAAGFVSLMGLLQAGCGAFYQHVAGFACDVQTGLPVSGITLSLAAGTCAWYARRGRHGKPR